MPQVRILSPRFLLSAKEFAQKINGHTISRDIMHDMLEFEKDVREGRIDPNHPLQVQPEKEKTEEKIPEKELKSEIKPEKETGKQTDISSEPEKVRVKPEFTEEMKEYLVENAGKISGIFEALDPISEYFGSQGDDELCEDLEKLAEAFSDLADALEGENDEEIEAAYHKLQESMEKVLLSKYRIEGEEQEKTGFELLLGKNYEGVRFSEISGCAYENLNQIIEKFGLNEHLKVSDEFKKEIEKGAKAAVDKLKGKLEKIRESQKEEMPEEIRTAFDALYEKCSSSASSMHELTEVAAGLKEKLKETPNEELSTAVIIFASDIQHVTQGFTYMDNIPIGQLATNAPVQKVTEEKIENQKENSAEKDYVRISIGDLQKEETEEKATDPRRSRRRMQER